MFNKKFRDKHFAYMLADDIFKSDKLKDLKVSIFDKEIALSEMINDNGWLEAWMYRSDVFGQASFLKTRLFNSIYCHSEFNLGQISIINASEAPKDSKIMKLYAEDALNDKALTYDMSYMLMKAAILSSLNYQDDGYVSCEDYAGCVIEQESMENIAGKVLIAPPNHADSARIIFTETLRTNAKSFDLSNTLEANEAAPDANGGIE